MTLSETDYRTGTTKATNQHGVTGNRQIRLEKKTMWTDRLSLSVRELVWTQLEGEAVKRRMSPRTSPRMQRRETKRWETSRRYKR